MKAALPLLALSLVAGAALAQGAATIRVSEEGGEPSYRFEPATLAVSPGASVTVEGGALEPHTLTHDAPRAERAFDTGNVDPGATATFAAPEAPGEYAFKCIYHPGMRGTLTVSAPAVSTAPPAGPTTTPTGKGVPLLGVAGALAALGAASALASRRH